MISYEKACLKLNYLCIKIFLSLIYEGFCAEEEGEENADDKPENLEFDDGVGMGEGEGFDDVGDEIEHEEQLEGLEGEQHEEQKNEKKKEDKGFEMENDFEGDMFSE